MAIRPQLSELLLDSARIRGRTDVVLPKDEFFEYPERAIQFGTGAFMRAFVDYFLDCANHRGKFGGRVVAVGSTDSGRDRAFAEQDGLYTLASRGIQGGAESEALRIVSVVSRALSATDHWEAVLEVARSPDLEFIFSNSTEVGIVYDPDDTPDMSPPRSFPGKLTRFLVERARAFEYDTAWNVMVLPCELIENNGDRLREIVIRLAHRWEVEPAFFRWLDASVPFCNTLVDRIVPGTPTGEARERLTERLGYEDALLTTCEPYRLFAIEAPGDMRGMLRFADADPGVIVVDDIGPYRERKVRLLSGAHTLMVPVAIAMGAETVKEAIEHPAIGPFVRKAMRDEIAPYISAPGASRFAGEVLERFANPSVRRLLADITLQATVKMRGRVVPSIVRYAETAGRVPPALAFGFAAHIWFAGGDLTGAPSTGRADDQAEPLRQLWTEWATTTDYHAAARQVAREACGNTQLWERDLGRIPGFCDTVAAHLGRIRRDGMAAALAAMMAQAQ